MWAIAGGGGGGGIECFTQVADQYGDNPALFKRILDEHGLELVCLYGGGKMLRETREKDVAYNRRVAEFVAAVGGDRLNLGGGDRRRDADGKDHFTDDDVKDLCETMNLIGEVCRPLGVKACYHPHIDTIGEEQTNIERIFELTDPQLLFAGPDPAHLVLGGFDPLSFFDRYFDRIAYLHLKNVPAKYTAANWRDALRAQRAAVAEDPATQVVPLFSELDDGQIDLRALVKLLRDRGYEGWITTEIDDTALPSPKASAQQNRKFWESVGFSFPQ